MNRSLIPIGMLILILISCSTQLLADELFQINPSTRSFVEIEFNLDEYEFITNDVDGVNYQRIYHPRAGILMEEGMPELPVFSATIAIPYHGSVTLDEIEVLETETISGVNIYPSQGSDMLISPAVGFLKNNDFYNRNEKYPYQTSTISEPAVIRDFRFVNVAVTPFRYNPAQSELTIDRHIRLRVNYDPSLPGVNEITGPPRKLSRSFENIYRAMFLNYEDMRDPSWEYQARSLLVIYHHNTSIQNIVDQFVSWKRDKGFEVTAVNTSTMTTTTAIKNYILNAYNTWENPPEYVALIGGGSGSLTIPYFNDYSSPGDHPYGLLAGNDDYPDVFVGRFPIADATQLQTIWNKIRNYEREPFLGNTSWYRHALLVGDTTTSSGISPKITMKYVKELMEYQNDQYQFTEYYSGSASTVINNAFNQGIGFFPFRGYIGFANWTPNDASLNNGLMMPLCFFMTCATLYFDNNARAEKIVNMGAPNTPKGAIAAIGMTTGGTKTITNNALVGGFMYGIMNEGLRTMGETLARGKIFLHQTYGIVHPSLPVQHTHKASLMGDPSMDIWIDIPKVMNVDYEEVLPKGRNFLDIVVTDDQGLPLEEAWVTIRQGNDIIFATGYTDANGQITHFFDPDNSGEVKVTVTKPDYIPHLGSFDLSDDWTVALQDVAVLDPFNSGTNSTFALSVKNFRDVTVNGVVGTLSCDNPYIEILEGTTTFGNVAPNATAIGVDEYEVALSPAAPNFMPVIFTLTLTDNADNNWTSKFLLRVNGSNLKPTALLVGTNNQSYINPGATETLRVTIQNSGQVDVQEVYGVLRTRNPLLDISDSLAFFGNIAAGQSVTSTIDNSFIVTALEDLIVGMKVDVEIYLYNNYGFAALQSASLPVGLVTVTDPLGPCDYGYYIYGMEDTEYEHAPTYDWIEIAPQLGGPGVNTGLTADWANNQNVMTMLLPFTFKFYGIDYDQISVCANGWISFGVTEQATFRNFRIPGPMVPSPIVAVFWDNHNLSSGGVYTYYDEEDDIFIVQWQNVTLPLGSTPNTFQVILYNPELEPTIDDGFIKLQYKVYNNVNNSTSYGDYSTYCTIGIGDHTSDVGLTYTFSNQYPTAAATLTHEKALMIVGPKNYSEPFLIRQSIVVFDEDGSGFIDAGERIRLGIYVKNIGYATASNVVGTISTSSNFISMVNNSSPYYDITTGSELVNQEFFEFIVSASVQDGYVANFVLDINSPDANVQFPFHLTINKPSLQLSSYMIEEIEGNHNGQIDPGETVNLILHFTNPTNSIVKNTGITVASSSNYINIETPSINIGDVSMMSNLQQAVRITIENDCPIGEIIPLAVSVHGENITTYNKSLNIGISVEDIFHNFENSNGNFVSNNNDGWQWGIPTITPFSGTKVWGTVLAGNYADAANWLLDSEDYLITPTSKLTFYHYYNIENYWDGGNVKISMDNGNTWQIIHPDGEYPVPNVNSGNSGIPNQPAYSGNSNGWQEAIFDLSPLFGQIARFRWHFGSGPWVNNLGWYIDDMALNVTAPMYAFIKGNVELLQSPFGANEVIISAGEYSVKPDLNGNYTLVLPAGNYNVTAFMPYHYSAIEYDVVLDEAETITNLDFSLQYLTPASNLRYHLINDDTVIELTWYYEPLPELSNKDQRANNRDRDYTFNLYRQQDSGIFQLVTTTNDLYYSETLPIPQSIYRYYVVVEYPLGNSDKSNFISTDDPDFDTEDLLPVVWEYSLKQNYPNPFNPNTTIYFTIPQQERVTLKIYNIKGELVKTVVDEVLPAGIHSVQWQGVNIQNRRVSSGIYFYQIQAGKFSEVKKALLLK